MSNTPETDAETMRDELNNELIAAREDIEMMGIRYAAAEMHHANNMQEVIEQRDMLADALRECREDSVELLGERDWWKNEPRLDYKKRFLEIRDNVTRADEALQSLA